jgi:hypothetical protein
VEEDSFQRADGPIQWLRWQIRPWHDAAGRVAGIVGPSAFKNRTGITAAFSN